MSGKGDSDFCATLVVSRPTAVTEELPVPPGSACGSDFRPEPWGTVSDGRLLGRLPGRPRAPHACFLLAPRARGLVGNGGKEGRAARTPTQRDRRAPRPSRAGPCAARGQTSALRDEGGRLSQTELTYARMRGRSASQDSL